MPAKVSRKIEVNIDDGLWVNYGAPGDDYNATAQAFFDEEEARTYYTISLHKGYMPAFSVECYADLPGLVAAMRMIEPDLRRWRTKSEE